MIIQDVVWTIALAGMGLVTMVFLYIIGQAGRTTDDAESRQAAHSAHVIRRWLFGAGVIGFIGGTYATLRPFPIPAQHAPSGDHQVVKVSGMQWAWQISPDTVEVGSAVEFQVTSSDVNHGFAIYSPDGRIVAQTQAMPGYTNKIVHVFDQPGSYPVMCLEYCGLGHAPMTAAITVVAAREN